MKQMLAPRGGLGHPSCPDRDGGGVRGCREDGPNPHDLMVLRVGDPAAQNLSGANLDRLCRIFTGCLMRHFGKRAGGI